MKIGIIGLGFVGSAIKNSYDNARVETVCRDPYKGFNSSIEDLKKCDCIFLCVPSPSLDSGECDTSVLKMVLKELNSYNGVIVSKVTAPPSVYKSLQQTYKNLVHAPEFLVAATAKEDYLNGTFSIIGGDIAMCEIASKIILLGQKKITSIKFCSITEASLAKYTINSFLASKVMFMNQIKELSDSLDCNYESLKNLLKLDERFGNSHLDVPGPDGQYGFGGACFPKDTKALIFEASSMSLNLSILNEVIKSNNLIRGTNT